jgi:hypothetical protein
VWGYVELTDAKGIFSGDEIGDSEKYPVDPPLDLFDGDLISSGKTPPTPEDDRDRCCPTLLLVVTSGWTRRDRRLALYSDGRMLVGLMSSVVGEIMMGSVGSGTSQAVYSLTDSMADSSS